MIHVKTRYNQKNICKLEKGFVKRATSFIAKPDIIKRTFSPPGERADDPADEAGQAVDAEEAGVPHHQEVQDHGGGGQQAQGWGVHRQRQLPAG